MSKNVCEFENKKSITKRKKKVVDKTKEKRIAYQFVQKVPLLNIHTSQ